MAKSNIYFRINPFILLHEENILLLLLFLLKVELFPNLVNRPRDSEWSQQISSGFNNFSYTLSVILSPEIKISNINILIDIILLEYNYRNLWKGRTIL